MIDSSALLRDLRRLLKTLDDDLRARISENGALDTDLKTEWQDARDAGRTAGSYTGWLDEEITQAAVHWILACVFIRFLEDNNYLARPILAGPSEEHRALARDRHEQYFRKHPTESDRNYLLAAFREVAELPGMAGLFDERHNPVFRVGVSGDGAMQLLAFWQKVNPDSGKLVHDFSDSGHATRFLGDLYQDLSEGARKRYALLQTPVFVEEFILDRALTPALNEFGYREVRVIDPTCGSGHFLLGAFQRMFDEWARNEPARNVGDIAQKALDAVYGVDLNPFAVAIARFRLLIAALNACRIKRLRDAAAFRINVATGDSLLHGRRYSQLDLGREVENLARSGLAHAYEIEDLDEVNRILGQQYHVVVGNPPYITPKDPALNEAYRSRYATCHMKYSLSVPFTERFFDLAIPSHEAQSGGFIGMITTNSFMKREFGKKLIESFFPRVDLTHVIDTSGAYIPGHGTPTVILFARNRRPVGDTIRTVMGIKGEPATPDDPAQGLVWRAIVTQLDRAGSESAFVSVADTLRVAFSKHPWSIGGGGAADLKALLETAAVARLSSICHSIGFLSITGEDDAFVVPAHVARKFSIPVRPFGVGDEVRDWSHVSTEVVAFPYDVNDERVSPVQPGFNTPHGRLLWTLRTKLRNRQMFGKTPEEAGLNWWELSYLATDRLLANSLLTFAFVATHNHFALNHGGKVFNRSAPVIKLSRGASKDEHVGLLGLLNSSLACFWMKQTFHNKGSTVDEKGARQRTDAFEDFYEHTVTGLGLFPLVSDHPIEVARQLDRLAQEVVDLSPAKVIAASECLVLGNALKVASEKSTLIRDRMIALQEELDWRCYQLYGLLHDAPAHPNPPEIELGQRAFEIVMARRMEAGELETSWFERHRSTPTPSLPAHWSDDYKRVVEKRIALINSEKFIGLIERPEYKRRWAAEPWQERERRAVRMWLLDRLEDPRHWSGNPQLKSVNRLTDLARLDPKFMQVAEVYVGRSDFDVGALVGELVGSESVPFLPVLRYTEFGVRKREQWERTWELQREEDQIDTEVEASIPARRKLLEEIHKHSNPSADLNDVAREWIESKLREDVKVEKRDRKKAEVGDIEVPPKFQSKDFLSSDYWRLRGGLDVSRERWVSYPGCERGADGSLVIAWAGWDHLQQATAIAAYYLDMKDNEGWEPARLQPLLAGLLELVPWLKQWHNDYNPEHAARMGDYFESFVADEARAIGFTIGDVRGWTPAAKPSVKKRRKKSAASLAEEL